MASRMPPSTQAAYAVVLSTTGSGGHDLRARRRGFAVAEGGRARHAIAAAALAALLASACQGAAGHTGGSSPPASTQLTTTVAASTLRLVISPADGRSGVDPGTGITVRAAGGRITAVRASAQGHAVPGTVSASGREWRSRWTLRTGTPYTVRATGVDPNGRTATATSRFRTLAPARTFTTQIFEGYRQTYGVGMPIILNFSRPITHRRAVERSLELRTSKPVVGAWYWDGDQTLYFRPRSYWRPHTVVHFTGHLNGVEGAPGVYGVHTLTQTFSIGRSLIAVASTAAHHVRIYLDRRLFADWPISSGRPGDDTPNGTYLTIEKANPVEMKGPGYDIWVPWSVRFTWSGDYMHDAFWSVGEQGFTNVSHGCVNLAPADAETYYKLAVPGDPVTITGSPRPGSWDNGWTVWFLTWRQLVRGSALHQAVWAGSTGSAFIDPANLPRSWAKPPRTTSRPGNSNAA
jgi:lipoprotein-anchoring transpeptidase ErfK/SrfK